MSSRFQRLVVEHLNTCIALAQWHTRLSAKKSDSVARGQSLPVSRPERLGKQNYAEL